MINIVIIGAGGHSKVVMDTLENMGHNILGFYDDNKPHSLGTIANLKYDPNVKYFCAIGSNDMRKKIVEQLNLPTSAWIRAIHPSAVVSKSATIGYGTLVCAGAVIQPDTIIGNHTIINTNASVDHDCYVGNFTHIAPRAVLCGTVTIGSNTFICAGCTIINEIKIGSNVLLGANSLSIRDIPDDVKAYGLPARVVQTYKL